MADYPPKRATAYSFEFPVFDTSGNFVSGVTFTSSQISKDGGAFAAVATAPVEIGASGVYTQALSAAENTADRWVCKYVIASQPDVFAYSETVTRQMIDLAYPAVSGRSTQTEADGMVHADLKEWLGAAPAALTASFVQADLERWRGSAPDVISAGGEIKADVDAWKNAAINAAIAGRVDADVQAIAAAVLALIADANWDEAKAGHVAGGSFGEEVQTHATPAEVNAEVLDVLTVDTFAQPPQEAPAATQTLKSILTYLYKVFRNRQRESTTLIEIYADDAVTVDHKAPHSDDGTTYDRSEIGSGP